MLIAVPFDTHRGIGTAELDLSTKCEAAWASLSSHPKQS